MSLCKSRPIFFHLIDNPIRVSEDLYLIEKQNSPLGPVQKLPLVVFLVFHLGLGIYMFPQNF